MTDRPPLPPFDLDSALTKVQAAEDAWNTCDPERVAAAYTVDSVWRNRDTFVTGRPAIGEFLRGKWARELDYALRKNLWPFGGDPARRGLPDRWPARTGPWGANYGEQPARV